MDFITGMPSLVWYAIASMFVPIGFFGLYFVPKYIRLRTYLNGAIETLKRIKESGQHITNLNDLECFQHDALSHAWQEFQHTLHPEKQHDGYGQSRVQCYRATALAETFFTPSALVDTPLQTDFVKHLPGIMTGLGIIATFLGLISGLAGFSVSDTSKVQQQLANLMNMVSHAFVVSAFAIACAMLFTLIEKFLLTASYKKVETLCELIDSLFETTRGETYLEHLIQEAKNQTTQTAQLKESLVTELKEFFEFQTNFQIKAQERLMKQMSENISQAFSDTLRKPMADINATTKQSENFLAKMLAQSERHAIWETQNQEKLFTHIANFSDSLHQQVNDIAETAKQSENYLEKILEESEQQTTQAIHIKDALVTELAIILEKQNQLLIKAQQESINRMSAGIGQTVAETLREPIDKMGKAIEAATGNQSDAVNQLLTDVLTSFTAKMEEMFGDQMRGIGDLLHETSEAMKQTAEEFSKLAEGMKGAGKDAAEEMAKEITKAITSMENRQQTLIEQMNKFLEDIHRKSGESQSQSAEKLTELLTSLSQHINAVIEKLGTSTEKTVATNGAVQTEFQQRANDAIAQLAAEMKKLLDSNQDLQTTVSSIVNTANDCTDNMNKGATTLHTAATDFASAGKSVANTLSASDSLIQKIRKHSPPLQIMRH